MNVFDRNLPVVYVGAAEIRAYVNDAISGRPHRIQLIKDGNKMLTLLPKTSMPHRTQLVFCGMGAELMRDSIYNAWKERLCPCPCGSVMRKLRPLLASNVPFTGQAIPKVDLMRIDDSIKKYIDPAGPGDWSTALTRMLDHQSALLLVETLLRCGCCARHARYTVEAIEHLDGEMSFTET